MRSWAQDFVDQTKGPCILILDNHSTRNDPIVLEIFVKANVQVVTLHPHTTHLTQPFDKGFFKSFKTNLRHAVQEKVSAGGEVHKMNIAGVVKSAWIKSATLVVNEVENTRSSPLISGFAATGCWPLDRSKILSLPDVLLADELAASRASAAAASSSSSAVAAAATPAHGIGAGAGIEDDGSDASSDSDGEEDEEEAPQPVLTHEERIARIATHLTPPADSLATLSKNNSKRAGEVSRLLTGREHIEALIKRDEDAAAEERAKARRAREREMRREVDDILSSPPSPWVAAAFAKPKGPGVIEDARVIKDWDIEKGPGLKVRLCLKTTDKDGDEVVERGTYHVALRRKWQRARNASDKKAATAAAAARAAAASSSAAAVVMVDEEEG